MAITKRIALLVLALMLVVSALPAFAQDAVATVNTGSLNVRTGPGLNFGSVATLPYGFGVRLLARNSGYNWVLIGLTDNTQGWVNVNFLTTFYPIINLPVNDVAPASAIVPTATVSGVFVVNVRTRPDPAAQVVTTLGAGTGVQLIGRNYNATWANVRLGDGRTGWIISGALVGSVPVRGLAPSDGSVVGPYVPPFNFPTNPTTPGGQTYVVRAGDTLGTIARQYNVTIAALAAANGIYNVNLVYAGQTLIIP